MPSTLLLIALALSGSECPKERTASDVNTPMARAQVPDTIDAERTAEAIRRFAKERHFAVQELVTEPRGLLDFATMLFRDDIRVSVSKMRGEPISIAAYPLCACETDHRLGLKDAADAAVAEMRSELVAP